MITKNTSATKITKSTKGGASRIFVCFVIFVSFVVLYFGYSWWFSDERAIRNQLTAIAGVLTVKPNEGELGPVTRLAMLRKLLAPDVRLTVGSQDIVSRDAILALASRWIPPPGGLIVEFADAQVTVAPDRTTADVACTVKLTTRDARTGEPTVDAREVTVGFARDNGTWLVSAARTEEVLAR